MADDPGMDGLPLASASDLWLVLWPALAVALLRVGDVTLNVFRTVFTVQGRKGLAALFHGIEGGVWMAAAGIVFADMTPARMTGFVVGVMGGTLLGTTIIERLRLGTVTVRVYADATVDPEAGIRIARAIHDAGHGATTFAGTGYHGPVQMVLSTVRRRDAARVAAIAHELAADALVAFDNDLQPVPVGGRV
jgi:uncharacterized protein YebE (UPF0316 family)